MKKYDKKYKEFENKKLTTLVVEIDITKTDMSFRQITDMISSLEQQELTDNDLEVKDIYWK